MGLGMRLLKSLLLVIALGLGPQANAITGDQAEFKKIADNVYAFVGRRNDANALVLITSQGVVLVDTGNDPPQTRILQNFIKSITDQPVRRLTYSHAAPDHATGGAVFADTDTFVSHANAKPQIESRAAPRLAAPK